MFNKSSHLVLWENFGRAAEQITVSRMSHQCSGQSPLRTTSTAFVLLTSVFTLLTHSCEGQSQMVGPSKPLLALIGDDVILPCYLEPSSDVAAKTLEWSRPDLYPRFVHVRRDGMGLFVNQNPSYVGRTSVSNTRLKHGDISLQLSNVKLSDAGSYRCFIPSMGSSTVELVVGALSSPVVTLAEIDKAISRAVLDCGSNSWYPEPEVSWLDSEGHVLSAGPPETVRGPDGLYTVSSRVTVEKRHGNRFTCRVHQKTTNQTRETEVRILEDVFIPSPYCFAIRLAVVSVVLLLCCVLAGLFLKRRRDESRPAADRTGEDAEETEELNKKHLDEEKLQEKEEDKREMQNMISELEKQQEELQPSTDTHMPQVGELSKQKNKIVKKLEKINSKFRGDNESKEREHKEYLQRSRDRQVEIQELIDRITKWKNNVEKEINQLRSNMGRLQSQQ